MPIDQLHGRPYNMVREASELLKRALKFPPEARAALIASLIESRDGASGEDVKVAWQAEIDRRARELDEGGVQLVPWAEARRQIFGG